MAGVYKCAISGIVASGDKITFAGVEITLDDTSGASATAAATALKNAFSGSKIYSATSSSGTVTTEGVAGVAAHYICPIVKMQPDSSETESPRTSFTWLQFYSIP